jgi:hypothetical protein
VFIPQPRAYGNLLPKKDDSHCLAACDELDRVDQRIPAPDENDVDGYAILSWFVFLQILESWPWQVNQKMFAVIGTAQRILHQTTRLKPACLTFRIFMRTGGKSTGNAELVKLVESKATATPRTQAALPEHDRVRWYALRRRGIVSPPYPRHAQASPWIS